MTIVLICVICTVSIMWRQRGLTPITYIATYYALSYGVFSIIYYFEISKREIFLFLYQPLYPGTSYTATPLYEASLTHEKANYLLIAAFLLLLISFALSSRGTRRYKWSGSMTSIAPSLNRAPMLSILGVALLIASFYLIISIDFSALAISASYQEIKDPSNIGLDDPLSRLSLFLIRTIGPISFVLFIFKFSSRNYVISFTYFVPTVVSFYYSLITSSRYIIVFGFAATLYFISRRSVFGALFSVCIGMVFFNFAIISRSKGLYGLEAIDVQLLQASIATFYYSIVGFIVNAFDTFLVYTQASNFDLDYPLTYKVGSLSPLPSFIDGFSAAAEVRISEVVPFNSASELFHFGIAYSMIAAVALSLFLVSSERLYRQIEDRTLRLGVLAWVALVNQLFAQYQLRGSMRFVFFSSILFFAILVWTGWRSRIGRDVREELRRNSK